jgi:hypothetical protein
MLGEKNRLISLHCSETFYFYQLNTFTVKKLLLKEERQLGNFKTTIVVAYCVFNFSYRSIIHKKTFFPGMPNFITTIFVLEISARLSSFNN